MKRPDTRIIVVNLLILLLGALPLTFFLVWIGNLVFGNYAEVNIVYAIASGFTYTVVYSLPVALGGIIHQAFVYALPQSWTRLTRRMAAVVLTVVIPVVLLVFGQPAEVMNWFAIPVGLALLAYGLLMRLPADLPPNSTVIA